MKILIVEDELVSREKMAKLIQSLGYEPLIAANGLEGWKIWEAERPPMVITDWNMPQMEGIELCRKIRSEEGEDYTYMMLVTGRNDIQDVIKGLEAGADDYIAKPFNKDELKSASKPTCASLTCKARTSSSWHWPSWRNPGMKTRGITSNG